MGAELCSETPFGFRSARKHHQAAGVFIEAMNGSYEKGMGKGSEGASERRRMRFRLGLGPPLEAFSTLGCLMACQEKGQEVRERSRQELLSASAEFSRFLRMPHRGQPRRLFHHHHLGIRIANHRPGDRFFPSDFWFLPSGFFAHGLANSRSSTFS